MPIFTYITWNPSPFLYEGDHFAIGWYGTLLTIGFINILIILLYTFAYDKSPKQYAYIVFCVAVISFLYGAHWVDSIFYNWYYTADNPLNICGIDFHYRNPRLENPYILLSLRHGGFASHGVYAITLLISIFFAKSIKCAKWYAADRLFIGIWQLGVLIRSGNYFNGEIYGTETNLPWGVIFPAPEIPCHPTQIYEALIFATAFLIAVWLFRYKNAGKYNGLISGVTLCFTGVCRILVEFIKQPQMAIESDWCLNMGQWLSIPFVIGGAYMWYKAIKQGQMQTAPHINKVSAKRNR